MEIGICNFGALHFGTLKVTCLLCCVQNKEREAAHILRNYAFIQLQAYLSSSPIQVRFPFASRPLPIQFPSVSCQFPIRFLSPSLPLPVRCKTISSLQMIQFPYASLCFNSSYLPISILLIIMQNRLKTSRHHKLYLHIAYCKCACILGLMHI